MDSSSSLDGLDSFMSVSAAWLVGMTHGLVEGVLSAHLCGNSPTDILRRTDDVLLTQKNKKYQTKNILVPFTVFTILKQMLIYCLNGKNKLAKAKRGFSFAYKSSIYMPDLAGRPWPARKR